MQDIGIWVFVDGLPLLLAAVLCLGFMGIVWLFRRFDIADQNGLARPVQNAYFKRGAVLLLVAGAVGGFLPSLYMYATTGRVWWINIY